MRKLTWLLAPGRRFIAGRPLVAFILFLILLFGLILLGHRLRTPEAGEPLPAAEPKVSEVYLPAEGAWVSVPARVEKRGVIEVTALAPGIVSQVHVVPGRAVPAGASLVSLTDDYGSGSTALEQEIARNNTALAREIDHVDEEILKLREKEAGDDDRLTDRQEDLVLEELERENERRKVALKNSELELGLALRSDAVLHPKSLVAGRVQNVYVRPGQFVAAGTPLVSLSAGGGMESRLIASLTFDTALLLDATREAEIKVGTEVLKLRPTYFSTAENEEGLYTVIFTLPPEFQPQVVEGNFLEIKLPLHGTLSREVLVPLDAVFRSNTDAWIFFEKDGHARSQSITIRQVIGNYAVVSEGLSVEGRILLNRALIDGEAVEVR